MILPRRLGSNLALAAAGLLVFLALMLTSGRITAGSGLGWDGRGYAAMMAEGLDQGSVITRSRPLLPLVTRAPHALGLDVIASFQFMNAIYAFVLYLFLALILDLYGASTRVKAVVIVNLALCVATSTMYAYYPVQIDLGALTLVTAAFYFVVTDRHWLAGAVCMLAVGSREFGAAVVLCGLHRALRRRRLWPDAIWYLPAGALTVVMYGMRDSGGLLTAGAAVTNLMLWRSPLFVLAFLYFAVTVFGGISTVLAIHPRWCVARLREQPELATFLAVIVGLAVVGHFDIWRYLVFSLPIAVVLVAQYYRDRLTTPDLERPLAAAITFVTLMTQRPFDAIDETQYFRDWFPLYIVMRGPSPEVLHVWGIRLVALILLVVTIVSIRRSGQRPQTSPS